MTDIYTEGGFYETRSKQGESDWEDAAEFDVNPAVLNEDMRADDSGRTGGTLSISDLTKEESYAFKPTIYGSSSYHN